MKQSKSAGSEVFRAGRWLSVDFGNEFIESASVCLRAELTGRAFSL